MKKRLDKRTLQMYTSVVMNVKTNRKARQPVITVRVSRGVKQRLTALAKADRRKLGSFVRLHLENIARPANASGQTAA